MLASVQSACREPIDRGLWEQNVQVCKGLCEKGRQGVRRLAQQTGRSKRRVPRLTPARARRDGHPASWRWATADGRQWWPRVGVATL